MINIYEVIDRRLTNISSIKKGSWIDLTNPTLEELEKVIQNTEINKEIITKLLDEEELPRIEKRKEETVIILDTPYVADNNKHKYRTNPLGIIISEKGYLITVSLKEQPFLDYFKQNEVNNLRGKNKTSFILQIFTMVAGIYQKELTNINKYIDSREKILSKSTNNKELIHLLDIEKTLVYFINSLKANEIALEKIAKGTIIPVEKEDEELLEDALIENKQAIEMATIYREILSSMTDTYATIISNNLNDVMKFLAGITIVFSIPTMVASFIGMNVPLGKVGSSSFSFILIILLSLLLSLLIAFILKKKNML
ncbi:mg2 transporter protein CorA family protein [Mycoplasma sp. CAG:776]|nr:mg2 transporter protein CorA family protein [Mycoplasma sp. CAG:776]